MTEHEKFSISIEGKEVSELYQDVRELEVELDDELASMFRLKIAISQLANGTWTSLDDDRLTVWKRVAIRAGFERSGTEELISGYITHVKPRFDPDVSQCLLEIWGMDGSVLMDREEKLKDWPNKKDSDIASEIFRGYGFKPAVDNTEVHDEKVSTIIQRETDMQFLQRLALRNGFECYVEGKTGYFRKPQLKAKPQPVLAVHFPKETNVNRFSLEVNALTPAAVAVFQVDRTNKTILEAAARTSQQEALGRTVTKSLLPAGMNPAQVYVGMNSTTGQPEMTTLCQGLFHQVEWFVTGEGEIAGNHYGHVLKPRRTVTIKGVGKTYSGVYYVIHVTHSFTAHGYTQLFRVKRNGIMPTGLENFAL